MPAVVGSRRFIGPSPSSWPGNSNRDSRNVSCSGRVRYNPGMGRRGEEGQDSGSADGGKFGWLGPRGRDPPELAGGLINKIANHAGGILEFT